MRGPAASLFQAGSSGRHQNNIRRDWFRKMGDMNYDHRVTWLVSLPLDDFNLIVS